MAFIGDAALSKLLDLLLGKSIDAALNFVADHKQVYDQLKEWKSVLPDIRAVLNNAEEKQIKDEGVKSWLEDLQDLAYDADDILDEFAYEELRLKLQKTQAQASTSKVRKFLPSCCTGSDFTPSSFLFKNAMIPKMKDITARLNTLATRRSSLGLCENLSQAASSERKKPARLQPTSVVDVAVEYVGRDNEKREMLDLLKTNNSDGLCVLSIVGMGGMGKTTLAQLVYNDASIEESFDHRVWICVSDDFDAVKITKTILQSIDHSSSDVNDLNLLQVKLKDKLSGKRVLVVLDDLWNESYDDWTILRSPFGAMTKIIVTTRLQNVSSIVDPMKTFHLNKLSQDDCLPIFTQHALRARNFDGHLQFKQVGENIVRKCNGLPLAAKAIGSFLRTTKNLVAGDICCRLEDKKQHMFSHRSRHSSYIISRHDTLKKFEAFDQTNSLRTFLPLKQDQMWGYLTNVVLVELLPRLGYLRVLSLCGYWITELPEFFENLKHLRYLNLSRTQIKCLPDSLCTIYHLETLLLKQCSKLQELPSKMENLVNLQYLDIRGADSIKRLPLGIGNLTNLKRLSDFVIGEGDGHRIGELKNLSNIRGDFYLSGLDNVNGQDARDARLNEKSGISKLVLQWSRDFEKPTRKIEVEERVLDSLRPREKLELLFIENFAGAKFSTWIADSSFKNLSSLKLFGCKNCKSLPPIGSLPMLKDLLIGGLDEVHKIGAEFFGENQSIAFASLETLSFHSLPNWQEWDTCEGDEQVSKFPRLRELYISRCPQLLGRLPTRLQSLQRLAIYFCRRLVVLISCFPLLRELSLKGCEELVDESSSSPVEEVSSLQIVSLSSISKFSIAAERIRSRFANSTYFGIDDSNMLSKVSHAFASLTRMNLDKCEGLVSFTESNFPTALKELEIGECDKLQYLFDESMSSKTCLLEHLIIKRCPSLIWLASRGDICNRLQHLKIRNCPKLRSLFLNSKLPAMLKKLDIMVCPVLECIAQDFHGNTDLEVIHVFGAENIKSLPRGLDKLSHLQDIFLQFCSNLVVCFDEIGLATTNLRCFSILDCKNIGALPKCIKNFTSLQELRVSNCCADISFPEDGFPTNLTLLVISGAPKIYNSLVEWGIHRLTSLQYLYIGCVDVTSFPEERIGMTLPPSLTTISIHSFSNLEFMCSKGFQHLTSLQYLYITDCPKLTSLPEKDTLLSLGHLDIRAWLKLIEKISSLWKKIEGKAAKFGVDFSTLKPQVFFRMCIFRADLKIC
ncbi:hypothetical protein V6N13_117370 [Hibiscus sabdariffa]